MPPRCDPTGTGARPSALPAAADRKQVPPTPPGPPPTRYNSRVSLFLPRPRLRLETPVAGQGRYEQTIAPGRPVARGKALPGLMTGWARPRGRRPPPCRLSYYEFYPAGFLQPGPSYLMLQTSN